MKLGRVPTDSLHQIVRFRSNSYTIRRPSTSKDNLGEVTESYSNDHSEDLWLFQQSTEVTQEIPGERESSDLTAIALPSVDVKEDDRINHGGVTYEVERIRHVTNAVDTELIRISFNSVDN